MTDNPLEQYFRSPGIHLTIPSHGEHYAPGAIEIPESGELPVYPMTALDEITYKTPDALFNGSAIVDVIKSCIPGIKDPWQMPITDITSVLAAIRIASFGHNMDIDTKCPKCDNEETHRIDLRILLESVKPYDYSKPLTIGDLTIVFKPMLYKDLNENNKLQFEEQKMARVIADTDMETEKQVELLSAAFKKISKYTISTLCKNIKSIRVPDALVEDPEHILQFLQNCENTLYKKIKTTIIEQKASEALKPLKIKCGEEKCEHEYEQPFTLDMTSFFAQDS